MASQNMGKSARKTVNTTSIHSQGVSRPAGKTILAQANDELYDDPDTSGLSDPGEFSDVPEELPKEHLTNVKNESYDVSVGTAIQHVDLNTNLLST